MDLRGFFGGMGEGIIARGWTRIFLLGVVCGVVVGVGVLDVLLWG